jgi:hypothetical protein
VSADDLFIHPWDPERDAVDFEIDTIASSIRGLSKFPQLESPNEYLDEAAEEVKQLEDAPSDLASTYNRFSQGALAAMLALLAHQEQSLGRRSPDQVAFSLFEVRRRAREVPGWQVELLVDKAIAAIKDVNARLHRPHSEVQDEMIEIAAMLVAAAARTQT